MAQRHTFGLCMIVRDAADTIGRILEHAPDIWDQVIVVDTGSTDRTLEILRNDFPFVEIQGFEWVFNFSKARNYALSFIKTDTWMWLDADDTFDRNTAAQWRQIALALAAKGVKGSHIALPYHYKVNEKNEPLVVLYRERIFLGGADEWQWQGPVHEVCTYMGRGESHYEVHPLPVIHKPTRTEEAATDRNAQILQKAYEEGDHSPRTLYYLMKFANGRGESDQAISYGSQLLETKPRDPLEYEAGVGVGYAYLSLFRQHRSQHEWELAVSTLTNAVTFDPRRNEARTLLVEAYVDNGEFDRAIAEANLLSIEVPKTPATLEMKLYGAYRFEVLADIYLRN